MARREDEIVLAYIKGFKLNEKSSHEVSFNDGELGRILLKLNLTPEFKLISPIRVKKKK